jgi:hypothetical protein
MDHISLNKFNGLSGKIMKGLREITELYALILMQFFFTENFIFQATIVIDVKPEAKGQFSHSCHIVVTHSTKQLRQPNSKPVFFENLLPYIMSRIYVNGAIVFPPEEKQFLK